MGPRSRSEASPLVRVCVRYRWRCEHGQREMRTGLCLSGSPGEGAPEERQAAGGRPQGSPRSSPQDLRGSEGLHGEARRCVWVPGGTWRGGPRVWRYWKATGGGLRACWEIALKERAFLP